MRPLYPVDQETYARIGEAYLICSEYPEVFGQVTFKKFCSMFVDIADENEDLQEARKRKEAPAMYQLLCEIRECLTDYDLPSDIEADINEILARIEEKEAQ